MTITASSTPDPPGTALNNTARSEHRVIYRGESRYNRQMATQIIDVNPTICADNNRVMSPLEPININSINTGSINSSHSTISPRSYDPESNSFLSIDNRNFASRWFNQTASRISNSRLASQPNFTRQMFPNRTTPVPKDSNFNPFHLCKRYRRKLMVVTLFTVLVLVGYAISVRVVEVLDKRVSVRYNIMSNPQGSFKNAVNNQDLNKVIDEIRMEIQKLKEMSYKNSVAISGLSNGLYKVPGSQEDSESAKRSKFGKGNNTVNLNKSINRQDLKLFKKRQENAEFVPGSVEYDASITLQS